GVQSENLPWFEKGSGTFVRSTLWAVPAKVPDPFSNHLLAAICHPGKSGPARRRSVNRGTEVWITGTGIATPLGDSYPAVADNLLAGRSGVRRVTRFDVSEHPSQIAG